MHNILSTFVICGGRWCQVVYGRRSIFSLNTPAKSTIVHFRHNYIPSVWTSFMDLFFLKINLMLCIPRQLCCDCCIDTMTRSGSVIVHAVFIISYTEVFLCSVFQHSVIRHSLVVLKAVKTRRWTWRLCCEYDISDLSTQDTSTKLTLVYFCQWSFETTLLSRACVSAY